MRKWRVFFSGLMREVNEYGVLSEPPRIVHVKFAFGWAGSSRVFDHLEESDPFLLATTLAQEPWSGAFPRLQSVLSHMDSYTQVGHLIGTVSISGEGETEVSLWGCRIKSTGPVTDDRQDNALFCGFTKNGKLIHMQSFSIAGLTSEIQYGLMCSSNGCFRPFKSCRLNISHLENIEQLPPKITVQTSKDHELHELDLNTPDSEIMLLGPSRSQQKTSLQCLPFTVDGFKGHGIVVLNCGVVNTSEHIVVEDDTSEKPLPLLPRPSSVASIPLVVSLNDVECRLSEVAGGKGSSLAKLSWIARREGKFGVPKGLVVTTASYKELLKVEELQISITRLEKAAWKTEPENLQEICNQTVEKFQKYEIPAAVKKSVECKLIDMFGNKLDSTKFAVRSSALGEDSSEMSSAGQMETFLGVLGLHEVYKAVVKCWASQFSFVATNYKRSYGQELNAPMAVVIQEMVPAEIAGVMFTCDPVTGNPEYIIITANYGLGESVVSASVEPDTITLKRNCANQLSIHTTATGSKKMKFSMQEEGGTAKEEVSEVLQSSCCISKHQSLYLGSLALTIEEYFGTSMDIEWAVAKGAVYILQARPETSITKRTDCEIIHDLDGAFFSEAEFLTKANVGEVLPGCMTPLTISGLLKAFDLAGQRIWAKREGMDSFVFCPFYSRSSTVALGHVFFNMIEGVYRIAEEKGPPILKAVVVAVFGRLLNNDEDLRAAAMERHKGRSRYKKLCANLGILLDGVLSPRWFRQVQKKYSNYALHCEKFGSSVDLYNYIDDKLRDTSLPSNVHIALSTRSALLNMLVLSMLAAQEGMTTDVYTDFAQLTCVCNNVESADVPTALQDVGNAIAESTEPKDFQSMSREAALAWLKATSSLAGIKFRKFLERHGHRCIKEFDMISVPWGKDQLLLVNTLQEMVASKGKTKLERPDLTTKEAVDNTKVPLSLGKRKTLEFLLPKCKKAIVLREASKSLLIRQYDQFRGAYSRLAELMVAEGRLPSPRLIYFFCHHEIGIFLKQRSPSLLCKVIQRQQLFPFMNSLKFAEIVQGIPQPQEKKTSPHKICQTSVSLKGYPVSQGVATGCARVVTKLEEAACIQAGDILITYSTDIGWSPYFPLLSGIVTEIGGLISHGAVVAREYGVPCIVCVCGATELFQSGDMVTLDGNKGLLYKLETKAIDPVGA